MKHFIVYDAATGEVLRSGQCQDDDLDLQAQGESEMVKEGAPEDIATLRSSGEYLVSAEDGSLALRPPRTKPLNELKSDAWAAVKRRRQQAIAAGCTVPGLGVVQTDDASMNNITQAVLGATVAAVTSQPFTVPFTLADNSTAVLDGAQTMALGKVTGERKSACHVRSQQLRAQIQAASNRAELAAVDIDAGWPA